MGTGWYVDNAAISLRPGVLETTFEIDELATATVPTQASGRFEIAWMNRNVELLRISVGNSMETELWVDGVRVPQGVPALRRDAKACAEHGKRTKRHCPSCEKPACKRCAAVDGVRCQACFDAAAHKEIEGRKRAWLIGAGFLLLLAVGLGLYGAAKIAGAFVAGAVGMAVIGLRRRKKPDDLGPPRPLAFEVPDKPPQLVGDECPVCSKRIGTERDGRWCNDCRQPLHKACRTGHPCKPPKTGPDWNRLASAAVDEEDAA